MTDHSRYSRQERFAPLGSQGVSQLAKARVVICGAGALGTVIAERLARSGVGHLRIIDRDWVELSNLQRQTLFTEEDAKLARPKAIAAAEALRRINADIEIVPIVDDLTFANVAALVEDCDLILDGTDNFETRFLLNDFCVRQQIAWVHGGCLGSAGQVLSILPGETACFRCLVPELPPREALETCDSAGVLGPAVGLIGCWQAAEALKIASGNRAHICRGLIVLDSWHTECRIVQLGRNPDCPCCVRHEFPFLNGEIRTESTILCGKNAVQLESPQLGSQTLSDMAQRLSTLGPTTHNAFFVRLSLTDFTVTVFKGGRTIVEGTTDVAQAKSVLARTLGS